MRLMRLLTLAAALVVALVIALFWAIDPILGIAAAVMLVPGIMTMMDLSMLSVSAKLRSLWFRCRSLM